MKLVIGDESQFESIWKDQIKKFRNKIGRQSKRRERLTQYKENILDFFNMVELVKEHLSKKYKDLTVSLEDFYKYPGYTIFIFGIEKLNMKTVEVSLQKDGKIFTKELVRSTGLTSLSFLPKENKTTLKGLLDGHGYKKVNLKLNESGEIEDTQFVYFEAEVLFKENLAYIEGIFTSNSELYLMELPTGLNSEKLVKLKNKSEKELRLILEESSYSGVLYLNRAINLDSIENLNSIEFSEVRFISAPIDGVSLMSYEDLEVYTEIYPYTGYEIERDRSRIIPYGGTINLPDSFSDKIYSALRSRKAEHTMCVVDGFKFRLVNF